jgi:NADH:ubiquinone oxidoreductase subunit E
MVEAAKLQGNSISEEIPLSELRRIDPILNKYGRKPNYLIPILKECQEIFGYLPAEVQRYIAKGLGITSSQVYGVVTFYSFFTMIPRGKYTLRCCLGTACYVKGAPDIVQKLTETLNIKVGETTKDRKFTLEAVRCLGACGLAPCMMVISSERTDTHGMLTPASAVELINIYE